MAAPAAPPEGTGGVLGGVVVTLAACVCAYWLWLGSAGFQGTEGHRVIPGWTMLETGEWLRVAMFDQTYLRKPPGMPWAIAASAGVLGESEFSARAVSAIAATVSALVAFAFARRWFGPRWGVFAGLAQALTPLFWQPGRTADIEALHNLGVQVALLSLVDALAGPRRERSELARQVRMGLIAAAGLVVAALAKGPAGAPALAGLLVGLAVVHRGIRVIARPAVVTAALVATAVLVPLGLAILRANADAGAVREDVSGFMWSWSTLIRTSKLPVEAFVAAMPAAVWALFPFGRDATAEADRGGAGAHAELRIARVLAWSWLASLGVCVLAGLSNPRYAMPGAVLLAPLAAYVAKGAATGAFTRSRRLIARLACLGHPIVLGALLVTTAVFLSAREAHWDPDRAGGPDAGRALADLLPAGNGPIELWADGLVEARPDVLLYAGDEASRRQQDLRVFWRKRAMQHAELPPPGALLALRTDTGGDERTAYRAAIEAGTLVPLGGASVHTYEFSVYRVREAR